VSAHDAGEEWQYVKDSYLESKFTDKNTLPNSQCLSSRDKKTGDIALEMAIWRIGIGKYCTTGMNKF